MPSPKRLQPRKSPEPPKKARRLFPSVTPLKALLALAVGAIIPLIGCFLPRTNLAEISALKDKAIGLAENGESAQADEVLQEIEKKIPGDLFVARNLVVVRLNRMEGEESQNPGDG